MKVQKLFLLCAFSLLGLAACDSGPQYVDINSVNDFKNIKLNGNYRLKTDLNFESEKINPIGNINHPFTGRFVGGGHTISNFIINDSSTMGLFGYVNGAYISDLNINTSFNIDRIDYSSVGLLAGFTNSSNIVNCSSFGEIKIETADNEIASNIGGLVGYAKKSIVDKCFASTTIDATSKASIYVGGLVGYNGGEKALESKITNSYSYNATITCETSLNKAASYVGGVVGKSYGTIDKCFSHHLNLNSISDNFNAFVGGVVADNNDGLVINSFGASNISSSAINGRTFRGLVVGRNFSSDIYKQRGLLENNYGASNALIDKEAKDQSPAIEQTTVDTVYLNNLRSNGWYKNILKMDKFQLKPGYFPSLNADFIKINEEAELGSAENPIEITTSAQLATIQMDKSYKLMNDIDLNGVTHNPIGEYNKPYIGVFDGNHKTIKNFKIEKTDANQNEAIGLFGFLNGTIKNLKVESNIKLTGTGLKYVGAISGYANKSLIHDCHSTNTGEIKPSSLIYGGLIGYLEQSKLYRCSATGTDVTLSSSTDSAVYGGLLGEAISSNLYESFAKTNIKVEGIPEVANTINAGGLIGRTDSVIKDVYAHADIKVTNASGKVYLGGLLGQNHRANVYNIYTKVKLICDNPGREVLIGGIAGYNDDVLENCYYCANDEVNYSCGHSITQVNVTRVKEENLKGLAKNIGSKFYDGEDNLPHLNFEREGF